ncbi:MAG: hypothetical protein Q9219_005293 [cf. Caloplaca sp. 3 TL-2023]
MSQRARQAPHAQRSGIEDLRGSNNHRVVDNEELHSRISDLTVQREMAEDQKQIALKRYVEVEKHNRELRDELVRLRETNGQESADVHEQQQKLDELQNELLGCKDTIEKLKGEKKYLERQLGQVSQNKEAWSKLSDFWRRLGEELTEKVPQLERQLETSNEEKAELLRKIDHMVDLEQQLQELQAKESGYESEIGGLKQRLKTLATKDTRQEEQIQTLKQSLDQVHREKKRCEDQLRNHDKNKALADADIKTLKERIAKLEASAEAGNRREACKEAQPLANDYDWCLTQSDSIDRDRPYLRDQIQVLKGEIKFQSSRGSDGRGQCDKLKDALKELESTTWLSDEGTPEWCTPAKPAMDRMAEMYDLLKRHIDDKEDRAEVVEKDLKEWAIVISDATSKLQSVRQAVKAAGEQRDFLCERILDAKGSIRVFCRIRPRVGGNLPKNPIVVRDRRWLEISTSFKSSLRGVVAEFKPYHFDRIFGPGAAQRELLDDVLPLCQSLLKGETACVFCYGPTNSGKTYTMLGPQAQGSSGLILAVLEKVLLDMKALPHPHRLKLQHVELYNGGKAEHGLSQEVSDYKAAGAWVAQASQKRRTRTTENNRQSSRSHWGLILTLTSTTQDRKRPSNEEKTGRMLLLDLAGTEPHDANADAASKSESTRINSDLSGLRGVIYALAKRERPKFRNSELLKFLERWLDRQGVRILSLVHVNENTELQSIQNTMEFSKHSLGNIDFNVEHSMGNKA